MQEIRLRGGFAVNAHEVMRRILRTCQDAPSLKSEVRAVSADQCTIRSPPPRHGDRVQVQVDSGQKYLTGQLYS
jgi:hypothetical protein